MSVLQRPDGARIWWTNEGGGEPVVLVMGLAYPSDMWFRVAPVLARCHRVLRLDNRGAGRTGDVPGAPYTVEAMAADVGHRPRLRGTAAGSRSSAPAKPRAGTPPEIVEHLRLTPSALPARDAQRDDAGSDTQALLGARLSASIG